MFRKDLSDLVKGIRLHKKDEESFIDGCIQEIKKELREPDITLKANAIEKLTYLQMFGYTMDWASFNVVEVLSSPKFTHKRVGYLAASQSFKEDTEVVLLCTNQLKKDIAAANLYEAGLALNCLANICNTGMAHDMAADVVALLNTSRVYVRKRAVLCLFRIFLKFPGSLRPSFPRLKEKLDDPEMPVVSAAVNVICELARMNPGNYLPLSQTLFRLLTSSNNNWMLIKIIKLFGALTPLEKRLGKKLAEPLTNIINTTPATSLLYEAIQTCIVGLSHDIPVMRLCITKLRDFIVHPDQNLKYLGLLALCKIMAVHPKAVTEHRDTIIRCLDDPDVTIRCRALDLVSGMASRRNLIEITQKLVEKIDFTDDQDYKDDLVAKIIDICSQNTYAQVTDFDWYVQVLLELTHVRGTKHGALISAQLLDVATRVKVVRPLCVRLMSELLRDSRLVVESPDSSTLFEVLHAAAYICGEYADLVEDPMQVMEGLLQPRVMAMAPHIQAIFMQNVIKLFAFVVSSVQFGTGDEGDQLVEELIDLMVQRLEPFSRSTLMEVQERACLALALANVVREQKNPALSVEIFQLFSEPLRPVAADAIHRVPIPEGLDLDQQINVLPEENPDDEWGSIHGSFLGSSEDPSSSSSAAAALGHPDLSRSDSGYGSYQRGASPYILGGGSSSQLGGEIIVPPGHAVEQLPPELASGLSPTAAFGQRLKQYTASGRATVSPKTRRRMDRERRQKLRAKVDILGDDETPEILKPKGKEAVRRALNDEDDLASIDLSAPLNPHTDVLPVLQHRIVSNSTSSLPSPPPSAAKQPAPAPEPVDPIFGKPKRGKKSRRGATAASSARGKKAEAAGAKHKTPTKRAAAAPGSTGSLVDFEELHSPVPQAPRSTTRTSSSSGLARSSSSSPVASSSSSSSPPAVPQATITFGAPTPSVVAGQDANLQISSTLEVAATGQVLVTFSLKNLIAAPLGRFKFNLTGPVVQQASVSPEFVLAPSNSCATQVLFNIDSIQGLPGQFQCSLDYCTSAATQQLPFVINVPCSVFLVPAPITSEKFASISAASPALVSKKLRAAAGFGKALDAIVAKGNLAVVERMEAAAMCSATAPFGGTVIFLIKKRSAHSVSMEIRSAQSHLSFITALAKEF